MNFAKWVLFIYLLHTMRYGGGANQSAGCRARYSGDVSSLPMSNTCNLHTEDEQEDESGEGVSFPNYPHTDVHRKKTTLQYVLHVFYLCKVLVF